MSVIFAVVDGLVSASVFIWEKFTNALVFVILAGLMNFFLLPSQVVDPGAVDAWLSSAREDRQTIRNGLVEIEDRLGQIERRVYELQVRSQEDAAGGAQDQDTGGREVEPPQPPADGEIPPLEPEPEVRVSHTSPVNPFDPDLDAWNRAIYIFITCVTAVALVGAIGSRKRRRNERSEESPQPTEDELAKLSKAGQTHAVPLGEGLAALREAHPVPLLVDLRDATSAAGYVHYTTTLGRPSHGVVSCSAKGTNTVELVVQSRKAGVAAIATLAAQLAHNSEPDPSGLAVDLRVGEFTSVSVIVDVLEDLDPEG